MWSRGTPASALSGRRRDTRLLLSIVLGVFIVFVRWLDLPRQHIEAHPQLAQLVVTEHTIARALLARLGDAGRRAGLNPFAVERGCTRVLPNLPECVPNLLCLPEMPMLMTRQDRQGGI